MIIRTPERDRFTIVANVAVEDTRLSWKARGLLVYLLSRPDNWEVRVDQLVKQGRDGREAVMSGLRELESAGYLVRERLRGERGRFDDVTTVVYESPQTGNPTVVPSREKSTNPQVGPQTGFPTTENPTVTSTERTKTELTTTDDSLEVFVAVIADLKYDNALKAGKIKNPAARPRWISSTKLGTVENELDAIRSFIAANPEITDMVKLADRYVNGWPDVVAPGARQPSNCHEHNDALIDWGCLVMHETDDEYDERVGHRKDAPSHDEARRLYVEQRGAPVALGAVA